MATVNVQLVASVKSAAADTPEIFYTAPLDSFGTIITNFTASNDTGINRSFQAYIVLSGGTAVIPVVPPRNLVANRTDVSPEMAGQLIPAGGTLQMESSAADSISFTVSGREIS